MSSLNNKERYRFDSNKWFFDILIDILRKNEEEIEKELNKKQSNILNFTLDIIILNDKLSDIYYDNFKEFINQICIKYDFLDKYKDIFLKQEKRCVLCNINYPNLLDTCRYVYSYENGLEITKICCIDCIHNKCNINCYKCKCSFKDPYTNTNIYVNQKKVYCYCCYSDKKSIEEYVSKESIISLKDCVQVTILNHLYNNKILTNDLKTNYLKIKNLREVKSISFEIRDQLITQIEKYHIKHLLLTTSNKQEEMTFNRILDKFELENSEEYLNDDKSQYDIEQEFKLAIKYFPEYVDCDFHCAQQLTTFLIRVHQNELLKYIFNYPINISVDEQYYKYLEALHYENESVIPILLENKINFIRLNIDNHETTESPIQYCINKKKRDILNLFIVNFNKIKKYHNIKDEDIVQQEFNLIKSFNDNSS